MTRARHHRHTAATLTPALEAASFGSTQRTAAATPVKSASLVITPVSYASGMGSGKFAPVLTSEPETVEAPAEGAPPPTADDAAAAARVLAARRAELAAHAPTGYVAADDLAALERSVGERLSRLEARTGEPPPAVDLAAHDKAGEVRGSEDAPGWAYLLLFAATIAALAVYLRRSVTP